MSAAGFGILDSDGALYGEYIDFTLKPAGFFSLNPANDVPPSKAHKSGGECCH